jgi:hypothetical protein
MNTPYTSHLLLASGRDQVRCYVWRSSQAAVLLSALAVAAPAHAVFTFLGAATPRIITLQVGSTGGTINNVVFNVTAANIAPNPVAVTGVPSVGTPATTPAGGVRIRMQSQWPTGNSSTRLVVSSPAALTCVAGSGCGATAIPFTTISWQAFEKVNFTAFDIQNGSFTGVANQALTTFTVSGASGIEMANTLVFSYDNATLYPSGQYTGRVTYTATAP